VLESVGLDGRRILFKRGAARIQIVQINFGLKPGLQAKSQAKTGKSQAGFRQKSGLQAKDTVEKPIQNRYKIGKGPRPEEDTQRAAGLVLKTKV
jgi:hypothetical protein